MNKYIKKTISILFALLLCFGNLLNAFAETADGGSAGKGDVYRIGTADELVSCFEHFVMDEWTRGLVFSLEKDISLEGKQFEPGAIFAGTFEGNGHTITGLNVTGKPGEAGLFGILTETAEVRNLNVSGTVSPSGEITAAGGIAGINRGTVTDCSFSGTVISETNAGGIVGINESTGVIKNCAVSGSVIGLKTTGGIVGTNEGAVSGCRNSAGINTTVTDGKFHLSDLKFTGIAEVKKYLALKKLHAAENTGGIAGESSGTILSCANTGAVGKTGNGYNVGGICGCGTGLVYACTNEGPVAGKENTGGIIGKAMPFVTSSYTEDLLSGPREEFNQIAALIDNILVDLNSCVNNISGDITGILDSLSGTVNEVRQLASELQAFVNTEIGEVNRVTGLLAVLTDEAGKIGDNVLSVSGQLSEGLEDLGLSIDYLVLIADAQERGDEAAVNMYTKLASENLVGAKEAISAGFSKIKGDLRSSISAISEALQNPAYKPVVYPISAEVSKEINDVLASLNGALYSVNALNLEIKGTVNILTADVRMLTGEMSDVVNDTFDYVANLNLSVETFLADLSEISEDEEIYYHGFIGSCVNKASVDGGTKTGGIAGSMEIGGIPTVESLEAEKEGFSIKSLNYRLSVGSCENYGDIRASGDYTGSVCGSQGLGAISGCGGYGSVFAEGSGYVGGIAGSSSGVIKNCYAKCPLTGETYVGGIVGAGSDKSLLSSGSTLQGNLALVSVVGAEQFYGAVAGASGGTLEDNYFISNTLQGINRSSAAGEAEPISYESLAYISTLPEAFKNITVRFMDGDKVLASESFTFGETVDSKLVPELPGKFGSIASWNGTIDKTVAADVDLHVVYTPDPAYAAALLALLTLAVGFALIKTLKKEK